MRMFGFVGLSVCFLLVGFGVSTAKGQEPVITANDSLTAYLPENAIGTLEVSRLAPLIQRIETSGALQMFLQSPLWQEAMKQDNVQKAMAGKAIAERQLGMSLWDFAKIYFGDRMIAAFYPPPQPGGPTYSVLVIRVNEAAALSRLWDQLSPLVPLVGDKIKITDDSGAGRSITFGDGVEAVIRDRWVVVSNNKTMLNQTLQNLFAFPAPPATGLLKSVAWQQMGDQIGTDHHVQLCLNLAGLKQLAGHRIIPAKLDNPLVSLLFGGYVELAAESPYFGSTLDIFDNHFELRSTVAGDPQKLDAAHQSFVTATEPKQQANIPNLKSPLTGISLTRDFAGWYRNREALLEAALLPGFDKFETGLANFLGGRDFSQDVLPMLGQRLTIVAAPQTFPHLNGKPGVQLPAVAVILDLAKPAEANDLLDLVFQTVVLISNLQAAQEGRQTFVLSSESYRDTQVAFAKYVNQPDAATLPISYNFQPASARVGNRYLFATSLETCRQLIDSLKDQPVPPSLQSPLANEGTRDIFFGLSPSIAADLLELNASVLHAANLQQGKSSEQSAQELSMLLKLLRDLTPLTFSSTSHSDRWVLELRGGWK